MSPSPWKKAFRVSPSQFKTFKDCERKWAIDKLLKWETINRNQKSLVFGSVLHAVVERYLAADDLGRDPNGNTVELYPEGWQKSYDSWSGELEGEISKKEETWVRLLVEKAIEKKILVRRPNRLVEHKCEAEILAELPDVDLPRVVLVAIVDLAITDPEVLEIQDHKTASGTRYLLDAEDLGQDPQVLVYAKAILEFCYAQEDKPLPESVLLRHNQFVKNKRKNNELSVRIGGPATVSPKVVNAFWTERFLPVVEEMRQQVSEFRKGERKTYEDWPMPDDLEPCRAYGGCPYQRVCFGDMTEAEYRDQTRLLMAAKKKDGIMGLASKLGLKKKKKSATKGKKAVTAPPKAPLADEPKKAPKKAKAPVEVDPNAARAPWHNPGCPACRDSQILGFASVGKVCRICATRAKKLGLPDPKDFEIYYDSGVMLWDHKSDSDLSGGEVWEGDVKVVDKTHLNERVDQGEPRAPETEEEVLEKLDVPDPERPEDPEEEEEPEAPEQEEEPAPEPDEEELAPKKRGGDVSAQPGNEIPRESLLAHVVEILGEERFGDVTAVMDRATRKGKRGRKKKGLRLLINCSAERGVTAPVELEHVLRELIVSIETAEQQPFYTMNAFERRDRLCLAAPIVANYLGTKTLIGRTDRSIEERELLAALSRYAIQVIRGC